MKLKKAIGAIALIAILICGIYAAGIMYQSGSTYDGSKTDVIALYENQPVSARVRLTDDDYLRTRYYLHPDGTAAQLPQGSLLVLAQCYDRGDANITLTDAKGLSVGALRVVVPAA